MSISMSGATIETGERDTLNASSVDASGFGGETANQQWAPGLAPWQWFNTEASGATLAGVTASFATNVSNEIDTYVSEIDGYLDQLENANSEVAFKGEAVKAALTKFIDSVKAVAKSYTARLKAAESEIVNSVATAYNTQDSDLSGDLNSDSGSLDGQAA